MKKSDRKEALRLLEELKKLMLEARVRQEIFFDNNLNGFKKKTGGC